MYNAYNQKKIWTASIRDRKVCSPANSTYMGIIHLAKILDVLTYHIPPLLAFTVEIIHRHASGGKIWYLLDWNVFFFFFFLLCQKTCTTDLLLRKYPLPRLRNGNRRLFWTRKCQTGTNTQLYSEAKVFRTWDRPGLSSWRMRHPDSLRKTRLIVSHRQVRSKAFGVTQT